MEEILLLDQHKISELCLKTKEINSTLYDIDIWCTKIHDVYDKISTK
jgi:hypothetical protein